MRAFVYKNLHKGCWSIKAFDGLHKGRVVAYSNFAVIFGADFRVYENGRQRVLSEGRKNIHAGVVGDIECVGTDVVWRYGGVFLRTVPEIIDDYPREYISVTYNPYRFETFVDTENHRPVHYMARAVLHSRGVYALPVGGKLK